MPDLEAGLRPVLLLQGAWSRADQGPIGLVEREVVYGVNIRLLDQ